MSVAVQTPPNGLLNGEANGVNGDAEAPHVARFASGLILPPPEIKSVIDRTATFVARSANPPQFEDKIREGQRNDPKFSFLNPADPYHAYYRHKLTKVAQGEVEEAPKTGTATPQAKDVEVKVVDHGLEPPAPDFIMDMPNISAIDLDIMKLTALFTARRGRNFIQALSAREARNFQFEFLRPTHSLFGYFNRLVDQYTKVLHPNKDMLEQLQLDAEPGARWRKLEIAKRHAKWEKNKREREKKRQDDQEAERIAFAEIDWHDYAIVQTIEFTAADATSELPPPMSVQEVENMTLAQKRYAAMILENTAEDVEAHRARQAAAEAEAAAASAQAQAAQNVAQQQQDTVMQPVGVAETPEDRARREQQERAREIEHAQAMQAGSGPMKIRTDYVPKLGAKSKQTMTTCTVCGQQIPIDELQEHMRIELLDPKWKEQRDMNEARRARASELLSGANVVSSLKNLARTRVDIFGAEADEEKRKKEEEEERQRRKEREKVVWDGHTASMARTVDAYSTNVNFEEQIAAIHRAKGLGPQETSAIGPGLAPASSVPAPLTGASSLPAAPGGSAANPAYSAATVASGPQPASAYPAQPPVMLPPMHYQGQPPAGGYGYPPGQGSPAPPMQAGQVRSADEMDGGADAAPPAKRQRVAKLPGGQLYPEADWIAMHPYPISLQVQLPKDDTKPEWKLDGTTVTLSELPLNLLVSTLRDRILQATGSAAPVSRIRLSYQGKMLTNSTTIASHNLEEEDVLVLSVSAPKKR
ncbi:Pre-mRNA splicing factor PRP21 like protein-domain-containing protein [Schizophyllum commune]